jgi:DNA-binding Lrp family transcriptional regulator
MTQETLQTVERALQVLQVFSRERTEVSQSELARTLGLPRTVVLRILNTLKQAGFLERVPGDSLYRIGLSAFEVGALYLANNPLVTVADELLGAWSIRPAIRAISVPCTAVRRSFSHCARDVARCASSGRRVTGFPRPRLRSARRYSCA